MAWARIHKSLEHNSTPPRAVLFPAIQNLLNLLALQPILASAQVTGDDRIGHCPGEFFAILLRDMGERAIEKQVAFLVDQLWRHRGKAPAVKQVHEECLKNVVTVVAEHDSCAAFLTRDAVKITTSQARAKRAESAPLGHFVHHDRVGVLILDTVGHLHPLKELGQHRGGKAGLALIKVAGQQLDGQKPAPF